LVALCREPVPLLDELTADDIGTPRATASIARAALRHLLDGRPDAIAEQLRRELAENDWLTRYRIRMAGVDVRGDTDWVRVVDVVTARREYYINVSNSARASPRPRSTVVGGPLVARPG
jgi:hypothetical protein